ncbi:hypothetical protein, partial [Faecalibaculum rodentium]|uniref:hypothetical protein n=1 Tax=Faecalibaculum rodentium TaxID=1702221 RepID=UPI0023F295C5
MDLDSGISTSKRFRKFRCFQDTKKAATGDCWNPVFRSLSENRTRYVFRFLSFRKAAGFFL